MDKQEDVIGRTSKKLRGYRTVDTLEYFTYFTLYVLIPVVQYTAPYLTRALYCTIYRYIEYKADHFYSILFLVYILTTSQIRYLRSGGCIHIHMSRVTLQQMARFPLPKISETLQVGSLMEKPSACVQSRECIQIITNAAPSCTRAWVYKPIYLRTERLQPDYHRRRG